MSRTCVSFLLSTVNVSNFEYQSGISPSTKSPTPKRVTELPSLQYRTIDVKKGDVGGSGRLSHTLTTHHQSETIPQRTPKKSNNSDGRSNKKHRSPRRVRFSLPPPDGGSFVPVSKEREPRHQTPNIPDKTRDSFSSFSRRSGSSERRRCGVDEKKRRDVNIHDEYASFLNRSTTSVLVTASPGVRIRVHPTGRYKRGTLSPTASALPHAAASPGSQTLLRAARDGEEHLLRDLLKNAILGGITETDLNAVDSSGRTILSYIASNGSIELLEQILHLPGLDPNKPDNEGNTPLHFAAQAGQIECMSCMLSRCRGIEIDARNNLGFTPLMKAALQGRNKCAKLLLFGGANPTLRDNGRGFRADQWARFCGRYVCADVIEKHARQRLLERSTSYGNWGGDNELGARVLMGKVIPVPFIPQQQSQGLKSKLRKVFRTSSGPTQDTYSSARLVTQLTSAALCASSPVLPSGPTVPPVVKSLIRPLTVPRLQITLVNNNGDFPNNNIVTNNGVAKNSKTNKEEAPPPVIKPVRTKKKK